MEVPAKTLQNVEYIRDRLIDLLNGDEDVDVGMLLYMLNGDVEELGGRKVDLKRHEIGGGFFTRTS
jgi:hypothetical protein